MSVQTPSGMSRRHFMQHLSAAGALTLPALSFANTLRANAAEMAKNNKAAIMLWMGGGPPTIDLWDLKPGAPTGGPFREIATSGEARISEHLPLMAKQMHHMAIIRSMSTHEADHARGRYYMHTGYVPNPNMTHPSYGAVLAHELTPSELEIPPFVSVGGATRQLLGHGYLRSWCRATARSATCGWTSTSSADGPMSMLASLERTSSARTAARPPRTCQDPGQDAVADDQQADGGLQGQHRAGPSNRYGNTGFARGCLWYRLVEQGCRSSRSTWAAGTRQHAPDAVDQQAA